MGPRRASDAVVSLLRLPSPFGGTTAADCRINGSHLAWSLRTALACHQPQPQHRRFTSRTAPAENSSIAVIGGGLTGLTTAYYLAKQLGPATKITLFEESNRLGGWIRTDRVPVDVGGVKGQVSFERGPRSLSSLNTTTWRFDDLVLWDLALDLGLRISSPPNQPRYVYYPDHIVPMPPDTTPAAFIQEPLFLESCFAGLGYGFRRLFGSKTVPAADISIADWIYEITGSRSVAENLASAMIHGIYGGNIYGLSARSVMDRFYWAHYLPSQGPNVRNMPVREQVFMSSMAKDPQIRRLATRPMGALLHFGEAGMETLPKALANALQGQENVEIKLSMPISNLTYDAEDDQVVINGKHESYSYDKVISTIPSQTLASLTDKLPSLLESPSVSIMTVNIWYPQENIKPPGFGYLIPMSVPAEQNPERALGVFFDSDVGVRGPGEPPGTKLFILMGGHYYQDDGVSPPSEDVAIEQAKAILERHLGIPRSTPCFAMARLAKECIPQHNVGHQSTMMTAHQELIDGFRGRLSVAGGSYSRIGAMGALRNGFDIAKLTASDSVESWKATGLEHLEFPEQFCGVPLEGIPVRRFKTSR